MKHYSLKFSSVEVIHWIENLVKIWCFFFTFQTSSKALKIAKDYKFVILDIFCITYYFLRMKINDIMVWRGVWGPLLLFRSPKWFRTPRSPFKSLILHMICWNKNNGEMVGGHIWVWSTIQTRQRKNASNREDFKR